MIPFPVAIVQAQSTEDIARALAFADEHRINVVPRTGRTATAQQAGEVCEGIRTIIRKLYGAHVARSVTIQYGGSMNAKNAAELLAQPDVDGGLIGGASLKPADFVEIINAANQE